MSATYSPAPQIQQVVDDLVERDHPHLIPVGILCVFTDTAVKEDGEERLGKAVKVSGLPAYLYGGRAAQSPFFCLVVHEEFFCAQDDEVRLYYLDTLLESCKAEKNEEGELKLKIRPYDIKAHTAVVKRRGPVPARILSFAQIASRWQPGMTFGEDETDEEGEE